MHTVVGQELGWDILIISLVAAAAAVLQLIIYTQFYTPEPIHKLQTIGEDFCGLDVNTPLGGREPMTAVPVLTFEDTLLTAVAATSTSDYTVVFLGTSKGRLKKVRRAASLSLYENKVD
ncbi:hypothetical protein TKK_0016364 [Trichogramma kaykai]